MTAKSNKKKERDSTHFHSWSNLVYTSLGTHFSTTNYRLLTFRITGDWIHHIKSHQSELTRRNRQPFALPHFVSQEHFNTEECFSSLRCSCFSGRVWIFCCFTGPQCTERCLHTCCYAYKLATLGVTCSVVIQAQNPELWQENAPLPHPAGSTCLATKWDWDVQVQVLKMKSEGTECPTEPETQQRRLSANYLFKLFI